MSAVQRTPSPFNPATNTCPHPVMGAAAARRGRRVGLLLAGLLVTAALTAPNALAAADFPPGPSVAAYPPGPSATGDPASPTHDGVIINQAVSG